MEKTSGMRWALVMSLLAVFSGCRDRPPASAFEPQTGSDGGTPIQDSDAGALQRDAGMRVDAGPDPAFDAGIEDGGVRDAGVPDAGMNANLDAGVITINGASLIYAPDRTQSPIDSATVQHLRNIVARGAGRPGVFAKVGDSVSVTFSSGPTGSSFLACFDGIMDGTVSWDVNIRLGAYGALAPTVGYFKSTSLGPEVSSWTRPSLATRTGRTASWPMSGSPSPVDQELAAINPRYAVVLYGSNDIGWGGVEAYPIADQAERYERNMRALTDHLISKGVIPLLTTMPPDGDYLNITPVFSAIVRAIAQGRQVPLIDLHREMFALGPPYGLRSDRTHPSQQNYNTCCWFDPASLAQYGANVRNLITLEALDRMRQIFDQNVTAFDPTAPHLRGDGSPSAPIVIEQVPWGELRDLRTTTFQASGALSCSGAPQVAGPQVLYQLVITRPMSVRVLALGGGTAARRVSLLSGPQLSQCLMSAPRLITSSLTPGTYYIAVNALTAVGASEYNLSISECLPGDPDC